MSDTRSDPRAVRTAAAVLVLLVGLALRVPAITGDLGADSVVYAQNAHALAHGAFTLRDDAWTAQRLPVFAPVALVYAVAGVSTATTHLWALLLSLAQLAMTMWLGWRLLGPTAGLLAGALLAFLPLDAFQAGNLMPDGPMATLLTAAAVSWFAGRGAVGRRSRPWMAVSGACLALAATVRVYSMALAALYVVDVLRRPRALRDLAWPLAGGLAVALPLGLAYLASTGDPFYPLRVTSQAYGHQLVPEGTHWLYYPGLFRYVTEETALYPALWWAALAYALVRRDRARTLLLLWVLPLLLFLEFGSMSFTAYVPVFKRLRFLTILAAPLCLLTASVALEIGAAVRERWARTRARRAVAAAVVAVAALVLAGDSVLVIARDRAVHVRRAAQNEAAAALLSSEPSWPVSMDHWRTACRLAYHLRFRGAAGLYHGADDGARMRTDAVPPGSRVGYLRWYARPDQVPAGFVVMDMANLGRAVRNQPGSPYRAGEIPGWCDPPPPAWRLAGRFGDLRIYRNGPVVAPARPAAASAVATPARPPAAAAR